MVKICNGTFRIVATAGFLCLALHGFTQKPREIRPFEVIPTEEPAYYTTELGRFDAQTHIPVALYHLNDLAEGETPTQKAQHWLRGHAAQLGLRHPDLADLQVRVARQGQAGTNVRFAQSIDGIPVHGGEIVVNVDPEGRIRYITNGYRTEEVPENMAPAITKQMAFAATMDWIGMQGPLNFERTRLVFWPSEGKQHLAWEVRLEGQSPVGDWQALMDAQTGEFLSVQDISCYHHAHQTPPAEFPACEAFAAPTPLLPLPPATGSGFVFDADPLSSAGVAYGGQYVDGNDATNASLNAERQTVSLLDITLNAGTYSLVGPYAEIQNFENPNKGLFTQASPTFNFTRFDDAFEAVNTYYHIDKSMRYLNVTLGVSVMPYQYATGVRFDPSGLNGADNSHYVGGTGRIAFGEGGVDDAEDSDVIIHELGHGLHDWITVGGLSNNQGLSEGTGDYWAQSYSRSLGQWTTGQAAYHFVFDWDGHNPFWGGRTTNYGATYPGGLVGQIHTDGQIWSTCMMKIYDAIGKMPTDRALWEGLAMTGGTTNQQDAAIAVRQAAVNMGYTSTQINTISTLLAGCGYTLPVLLDASLAQFDAERIATDEVRVDWHLLTGSEQTLCSIERRLDHETEFRVVGTAGLNKFQVSPGTYTYLDPNGHAGSSFYRLTFQNPNGETATTEIMEVEGWQSQTFSVVAWPNPSEAHLTIEIQAPAASIGEVELTVLDITGKILVKEHTSTANGHLTLQPAWAQTLAKGIYLIRVQTAVGTEMVRWVKS